MNRYIDKNRCLETSFITDIKALTTLASTKTLNGNSYAGTIASNEAANCDSNMSSLPIEACKRHMWQR